MFYVQVPHMLLTLKPYRKLQVFQVKIVSSLGSNRPEGKKLDHPALISRGLAILLYRPISQLGWNSVVK
jgi:hypothetical protein